MTRTGASRSKARSVRASTLWCRRRERRTGAGAGRGDEGVRRGAAGRGARRGVVLRRPGGAGRDRRAVRVGQVHAAACHGDAGAAQRRRAPGRWSRRRGARRPRAVAAAGSRDRVRVPAVLLGRARHGAGERRRRDALRRSRCRRAAPPRGRGARAGRPRAPRDLQAHQALRGRAAARRDRPRPRRAAGDRARGRADRQPRQHQRRSDHAADPRAQRRWRDDRPDHPRCRPRRSAAAADPDARRPGGRRRMRRLGLKDGLRVAGVGLRARPLRAGLSALGIAIGTAAIVAILGLSASSQAGLLAEIDRLGTNLLTVEAGQSLTGEDASLPLEAPARMTLLDHVQWPAHTALIKREYVYRNPMIPVGNTGGLQVRATSLNLLPVLSTGVARGTWLNAGTAREPVVVLGAAAAEQLGIDRVDPGRRVWLGDQWFDVAGVLEPSPLAPDVDTSVLVGYPAARRYLGYVALVGGERKAGPASSIYARAATGHETAVQSLLARTVNPQAPNEVNVSRPSDVLTARAAAAGAFDSLFLGLGVVALIVGAVGVANIMIISVLERRSEIGLRRALGATKGQIRTQFLAESILLALIGGVVGVLAGVAATAVYASTKGWAIVIPTEAWAGGIASAILIGAFAGLLPAVRASRMAPTVALRTV